MVEPRFEEKMKEETLELLGALKQAAHSPEERLRVLEARDKLTRLHTVKQSDISKATKTIGTCPDMCPEKERLMRVVQHQVALYEQNSDKSMNHSLAVKQYSRSSADQEVPLPHDLRPVEVLKMTMNYLLHKIMNLCDTPDVNLAEWYHFLWDRTRGIRKDITQQELCCQGSVALVEQCARFHIHCSARLVAEDTSIFDYKINTENLTKCLQTLKYMYHDLAIKNEACPNEAEFRAYIVLLNLHDGNFMWEVQQLHPQIQQSPEMKFAIQVYSALDKNNYVRFFKLVQSTTYLNACILLRYFNLVRLRALTRMLKSYSPRTPYTSFPLSKLKNILAFEDSETVIAFVEYYGLTTSERTHVILDRKLFVQPSVPFALERAVKTVESKRKCSVGEIICGTKLPANTFEQHRVHDSFDAEGYLRSDEIAELVSKIQTTISKSISVEQKRESSPLRKNSPAPQEVSVFPAPSTSDTFTFRVPEVKQPSIDTTDNKLTTAGTLQSSQQSESVEVKSIFTSAVSKQSETQFEKPKEFQFVKPFEFKSANMAGTGVPLRTDADVRAFTFGVPKISTPTVSHSQFKFVPLLETSASTPASSTPVSRWQNDVIKHQEEIRLKEETRRKEMAEQKARLEQQRLEIERLKRVEEEKVRRMEEERARRLEAERRQKEVERRQKEAERRQKEAEKQRLKAMEEAEKLRIQKQLEEKRRMEENRKRYEEAERKKIAAEVLENLLSKVEEIEIKWQLELIRKKNFQRKLLAFARKWKQKVIKTRKRKALDETPFWITCKSLGDEVTELYSPSQLLSLSDIKRYRVGITDELQMQIPKRVRKINLSETIYLPLVQTVYEFDPRRHDIFWKVDVSVPNHNESDYGITRLNETLRDLFEWKRVKNSVLTVQDFKKNNNTVTCCIKRIDEKQGSRNGLLFFGIKNSVLLWHRFKLCIGDDNKYTSVPVAVILRDVNITWQDELERFIENKPVSNFRIFVDEKCTDSNLTEVVKEALQWLAINTTMPPPLQMDNFANFLDVGLGQEFWYHFYISEKINTGLKALFCSPNVVINILNEAVRLLLQIVLNEKITRYSDFPVEFKTFLTPPPSLPCKYEHFPADWKSTFYRKKLKSVLNGLILPTYDSIWPPPDHVTLQKQIQEYCRKIFPGSQKLFLKIMAIILNDVDVIHSRFVTQIASFSWLNIVETIMLEKLKSCRTGDFPDIVVYSIHDFQHYSTYWWYNLAVVRARLHTAPIEPEDFETEESDEDVIEINLENTMIELQSVDEQPHSPEIKNRLQHIKALFDDLENSMDITRKINEKFEETLKQALKK